MYKWRVTDQNGSETLTSRSFSTRDAAADFKKKKDHEIRKQGSIHSLGSKDMRDAVDAMLILLAHKGVSLSDAAAFYVKHNPLDATVTIEEAVEGYLRYRKPRDLCNEDEKKDSQIRSFRRFALKTYTDRAGISLKQLSAALGDRTVASVMTRDIVDYLADMQIAEETYNNKVSDVKVFFDWCRKVKKCCEHNPAESVDSLAGEFRDPEIYAVDEVQEFFAAAVFYDPQLIPFLVLSAFAGIRVCEIKRMKVSDIDFESRVINIRPLVGKSKGSGGVMPRIIEGLPDGVWKWLEAAGGSSLVIDVKNLQKRRKDIFKQASVAFKANGFRHSFATYGYAFHQSDSIVRKQTGHRIPDTFFKYYATTVRKSDGVAYFDISPAVKQLPERGIYKPRYTPKIVWPPAEIVAKDVEELGYCGAARKYSQDGESVSDNAVRKYLKRNNGQE